MTTAWASWLAHRSANHIELSPGVRTPRSFGDARYEHLATRRAGGLFDFSFLSCTTIGGCSALVCANALQTRSLDRLRPGRIAYTLLLRDDGSVFNDATVWRLDHNLFWVFTGRRADHACIAQHCAQFDVDIEERSRLQAVIAVQGEISRRAIEQCFPSAEVSALPYYGFRRALFRGTECWIARLGYSGEDGYELVVCDAEASELWQALLVASADSGLLECGFDAADSLRIEAGHILFTRELALRATPFELGFARLLNFDCHDFRGRPALQTQRWRQPRCRLVGLLPAPTAEAELGRLDDLAKGGAIMTSARWSPLLHRRLGIGFVSACDAYPGTAVRLNSGARAQVARLPFYDPTRRLPRRSRADADARLLRGAMH